MSKRQVLLATNISDIKGGLAAVFDRWGWGYASEKFDGTRALATADPYGNPIVTSSLGNRVAIGSRLATQLRKVFSVFGRTTILDGELWLGYGQMQTTQSIVRKKEPDDRWDDIIYQVFDVPSKGPMISAVNVLNGLNHMRLSNVKAVCQTGVESEKQVDKLFNRVVNNGGEGIMLRKPSLIWQPKRVRDLIKIKPENDAEAVVVGYVPGSGRLAGMMGALSVRDVTTGAAFDLAGFTDFERSKGWKLRFPIGSVVQYRYTSKTDSGVPREARYWRRYD